MQQIREFLQHQVSCKVEERTLLCSGKPVTDSQFIATDQRLIWPSFHNPKGFTSINNGASLTIIYLFVPLNAEPQSLLPH